MLYPELFTQREAVRWHMDSDIAWASFAASRRSDEQAQTIEINHSRKDLRRDLSRALANTLTPDGKAPAL